MPKDFANRSSPTKKSRSAGRPHAKAAPGKRNKAPAKTIFHGASFSAGIVLGVLLAVLGAYVPSFFEDGLKQITERRLQAAPALRFEFDQILRHGEIVTDPRAYVAPKDAEADKSMEYLLQAASFRSQDDAEGLRAILLLMDLPTNSQRVRLENGAWFRVLVGPFSTQVQAQRVMTRLRQRNISALMIKRPVSSV
ncbi:MAG: SPOR domain-containing protein [Gammaproteobacteria bacterium]|nr:SPOR domain-containing protein [Gammaproteobacteria bacterium]